MMKVDTIEALIMVELSRFCYHSSVIRWAARKGAVNTKS